MEMSRKSISSGKKTYIAPIFECYGAISNFTTGGSGKKSEYAWMNVKAMGMAMGTTKECVQISMSMMRNTQMC